MLTCICKAIVHSFAVVSIPVSLLVVCVCFGFHSVYELVAVIGSYTCPMLLGVYACTRKELQREHESFFETLIEQSPVYSNAAVKCTLI